jgi:hypothetical protein
MRNTDSSTITFSFGQMGALVGVLVTPIFLAGAWAAKVDERLAHIQESTMIIKAELKAIQAVDTDQYLKIQNIKDRCCPTTAGARLEKRPLFVPNDKRLCFLPGFGVFWI